ncbi:MAG: flagellar basal body P-ring formation chaperone FlgA [Nitrospirales bacterium]|nr:flagellar basal body P-ring formation chaperone FlgA [Nitrospirales bacterium]
MNRSRLMTGMLIGYLLGGWIAEIGEVLGASVSKPTVQVVTAPDLERALLGEISRRYVRPAHHLSVQVLYPKQPIIVPKGNVHIDVDELNGGRTGRRAFRVQIFVNRQFVKTVNVVGELKGQVDAAVPVRWIKPREILTDKDIEFVAIDVPSLTHDFVLGVEEAVGKQVLRPLPPHQPIRKVALDAPPVIHKGDRVTIEVKGRGLLVQAVGLAKSAGRTGDTISVLNQTSGREILGMVMTAGVVEVPF